MPEVLLVIDVQRALLAELEPQRGPELLATLKAVIGRARAHGTPVVYVRHDGSPAELIPGTPGWEIAEEIAPRDGDATVDKRFADAFRDTNLASVLAAAGADALAIGGMQTDVCVAATMRAAVERGFRVMLVEDGHATSASHGTTEREKHDALHAQARSLGAGVVTAAALFAR